MIKCIKYFIFILCITGLQSCDKNRVFEKNIDIPKSEWKYDNIVNFNVSIDDKAPKNVFVNFRHSFFFTKRNVILNLEVKSPKGESKKQSVNIPLSEPNGMWYSDCAGDICSIQFPLKEYTNYTFADTGIYEFYLSQDMRMNPLSNAMAVGLRIENTIE